MPKCRAELALVVRFEPILRRAEGSGRAGCRRGSARGRSRRAVAQRIELLQREDRRIEHVVAALPVDVLLRVAGQRRGDLDALARARNPARSSKPGSFRTVRLQRSITRTPMRARRRTRSRKCGFSSGAPPVTSSVPILRAASTRSTWSTVSRRHHFLAIGARIDVAVVARLVAAVADVDLQRVERAPGDRRKIGGLEQRQRGVHRAPVVARALTAIEPATSGRRIMGSQPPTAIS